MERSNDIELIYHEGVSALVHVAKRCESEIKDRRTSAGTHALVLLVGLFFMIWALIPPVNTWVLSLCGAGMAIAVLLFLFNAYHTREAKGLLRACCILLMWARRTRNYNHEVDDWIRRSEESLKDES